MTVWVRPMALTPLKRCSWVTALCLLPNWASDGTIRADLGRRGLRRGQGASGAFDTAWQTLAECRTSASFILYPEASFAKLAGGKQVVDEQATGSAHVDLRSLI